MLLVQTHGYDVCVDPQERSPGAKSPTTRCCGLRRHRASRNSPGSESSLRIREHRDRLGAPSRKTRLRVAPSSDVLRVTQNRLLEKRFVRDCAIPTTGFVDQHEADLERAAEELGFPRLKTSRAVTNGKGQWRVYDLSEARAVLAGGRAPRR